MNGLVENWWKQAQRDFQSAKNSFDSKDYYASAFWSHQSIEKGLKSLRIKKLNDLPKIHNLVKLARGLNAPEEIIKKCARVNPVYTEVRYPEGKTLPADKINKVEAEQILLIVKEVLEWIEKSL
ncbi:MAG: HEPN domain-containing protein [Nanoarchaeota archaeon]